VNCRASVARFIGAKSPFSTNSSATLPGQRPCTQRKLPFSRWDSKSAHVSKAVSLRKRSLHLETLEPNGSKRPSPFLFFCYHAPPIRNLNGAIDEFAIYQSGLSPIEIHQQFEAGKPE
jgi:hypothetical protein